ncbi:unnamed protein product [Rhizoctonia solani]|uniref:Uncharacterized protein n=1 Tax=Rhizoctonia solani TaxID=456999 RepID=A0A8H3CKT4_9AGAM|nr:unnamed protein product [Rhizoctonia solani]CAE6487186.1 unnamed protein product [Rhizoctonia solani]
MCRNDSGAQRRTEMHAIMGRSRAQDGPCWSRALYYSHTNIPLMKHKYTPDAARCGRLVQQKCSVRRNYIILNKREQ